MELATGSHLGLDCGAQAVAEIGMAACALASAGAGNEALVSFCQNASLGKCEFGFVLPKCRRAFQM